MLRAHSEYRVVVVEVGGNGRGSRGGGHILARSTVRREMGVVERELKDGWNA